MRPVFKIVMFNTSHIAQFAGLSADINFRYCQLHGYTFSHEQYDTVQLPPSHEKVRVLQRHLGSADYLCWLDSDACVINFSQRLEAFCCSGEDLIIAGHEFGFDLTGRRCRFNVAGQPSGLNGGVMLLRSCRWSERFLANLWERCEIGHTLGTAFWEQGHLQQMLMENDLNMRQHTRIVTPASRLNRCDDHDQDVCEFILHLWGQSNEQRIEILTEVYHGRRPRIDISMPYFYVPPPSVIQAI